MKLRLGQEVHSTDGPFGVLDDIVVDPDKKTITNVVVAPAHRHSQARLVPISLVTEHDDRLQVDLDEARLRGLVRVSNTDYVEVDQGLELEPGWDIGIQRLMQKPYLSYDVDLDWADERVGIIYDTVPKGQCEVRRTSDVVVGDDHVIGHVEGFVADGGDINAMVVRTGLPGFRHDVLVPMNAIARVRNDRVNLSISKHQFNLLPVAGESDDAGEPSEFAAHIDRLREQAAEIANKLARRRPGRKDRDRP